MIVRVCVVVLGLMPLQEVAAEIFKFVDASGHVTYTDRPRHSGYRRMRDAAKIPESMLGYGRFSIPTISDSILNQGIGSPQAPVVSMSGSDGMLAVMVNQVAGKYGLEAALIHAVIHVESAYNPSAVSGKGAAGLMQLMPATADRYGVRNRFDLWENLEGGAHYLHDLMQMFDRRLPLVLAAYNAGEQNVIRNGYQIPPITETRNYVNRVMQRYYDVNAGSGLMVR